MNPKLGGVSHAVNTYSKHLNRFNISSTIVTVDPQNVDFYVAANLVTLGPSSQFWRYSALYKPWLENHILDYDIVMLHGIWLYQDYALLKVIKKYAKGNKSVPKLFVMPHGMLDPYFQKSKKRLLKAIRNFIYWQLVQKQVINEAACVLYTSKEEMLASSKTFWGYKPKKVLDIGLGVPEPPKKEPTNAFLLQHPNLADTRYLLFLGRIDIKKGIEELLDAYDLVYNKFWAQRKNLPKLVIAGPGIDTKYGQLLLKRVAQSACLVDNIYFAGMLSGAVKWGAFYGCESFISPSHHESFGISVVEAMACEKPVLITNKINIYQEILDGHCGFVENDNVAGCVELLTKWMSADAIERQLMSENALKTYQQIFKDEQATANLYHALVNEQ
ncbi:glycosyltransferase [Parasediminibacterium paludis]|uniref:Glycosyltransferase n=1 Tax=Parasediminibacterium paludis TaxID=908966 RepID=A0ABV8PTQ5_9BACT